MIRRVFLFVLLLFPVRTALAQTFGTADGISLVQRASCEGIVPGSLLVSMNDGDPKAGDPTALARPVTIARNPGPSAKGDGKTWIMELRGRVASAPVEANPQRTVCNYRWVRGGKARRRRGHLVADCQLPPVLTPTRTTAQPGNLIVAVFDGDDPDAVNRNEVITLRQLEVPAIDCVGLRLDLSSEDGPRRGHALRIQLQQILAHGRTVLADGTVALN